MARRPNVLAFGKWENEEGEVPYTVFFEKARKVKGGKIINPNGPPPQSKPEPMRHLVDSSGSRHKQQRGGVRDREISSGEGPRRHPRSSVGSQNSFDKTPPRPQTRNSAISWDGRTAPHGLPRNTSRGSGSGGGGGGRGHGNTGRVPRFGEWDENNPASADGFTHIFQKVREEKHTVRLPVMPVHPSPSPTTAARSPKTKDTAKGRCFPWLWRRPLQ